MMFAYLMLGLSVALMIFAGLSLIPQVLLVHYIIACGIMTAFYFIAFKVMFPALYPIKVKVYGQRYNSFVVYKDTRARITKDKKGFEFLTLVDGKKIKMPERKTFVKGTGKEAHADVLERDSQYFAISLSYPLPDVVEKHVIPENQRVWFAKRLIPEIKEATRPPRDKWMQMATMIIPLAIVLMLAIFMILYPPYFEAMDEQMKKIMGEKESKLKADYNELQKMYDKGIIVCDCGNGKTTQVNSNLTGLTPLIPPPG
jgi:hypothetical protein